MILFLISFFSLYGGIHLYAFVRFHNAFRPSRFTALIIAGWMTLTVFAPLLVRIAEHGGYDRIAKIIAWPGFIWMGFIFILAAALFALDAIGLTARLLRSSRWFSQPLLSKRISCETALLIAISATIYGYFEANDIRVEHLTVTAPELSSGYGRVRIVQVSDIHLGLIIREDRLSQMLRVVKEARPDILVSTGDLLDGRLSQQEGKRYETLARMISEVKTPLGSYAVTGNHEFYGGLNQSIKITELAGFRLLRNEVVNLHNGISISGVDDVAWKRMGLPTPLTDEHKLLKALPFNRFRLHLKHRPELAANDDGLIDLQLSGHTHKGQIFPFYLLTKIRFSLPSGTSRTAKGTVVHVSRGTGTWGPPIRFLAPPEVTIIDLVP